MTDNDSPDDPIPGWPPPPVPGPESGDTPPAPDGPPPDAPPPVDPTVPGFGPPSDTPPGYAAPSTPPGPATPPPTDPTVPGYGPPPAAFPPPGYQAPGSYQAPGGYPPPNVPPAPGGYAPQQPSGYPPAYGYGGQVAQREHPQGTTILVLGILSIICCGLLGPVAWIMGNNALKEIDRNPAAYTNRGNVQAGRIIGIVASVLLALGVVLWIILLIAGSASSNSGY